MTWCCHKSLTIIWTFFEETEKAHKHLEKLCQESYSSDILAGVGRGISHSQVKETLHIQQKYIA